MSVTKYNLNFRVYLQNILLAAFNSVTVTTCLGGGYTFLLDFSVLWLEVLHYFGLLWQFFGEMCKCVWVLERLTMVKTSIYKRNTYMIYVLRGVINKNFFLINKNSWFNSTIYLLYLVSVYIVTTFVNYCQYFFGGIWSTYGK